MDALQSSLSAASNTFFSFSFAPYFTLFPLVNFYNPLVNFFRSFICFHRAKFWKLFARFHFTVTNYFSTFCTFTLCSELFIDFPFQKFPYFTTLCFYTCTLLVWMLITIAALAINSEFNYNLNSLCTKNKTLN